MHLGNDLLFADEFGHLAADTILNLRGGQVADDKDLRLGACPLKGPGHIVFTVGTGEYGQSAPEVWRPFGPVQARRKR